MLTKSTFAPFVLDKPEPEETVIEKHFNKAPPQAHAALPKSGIDMPISTLIRQHAQFPNPETQLPGVAEAAAAGGMRIKMEVIEEVKRYIDDLIMRAGLILALIIFTIVINVVIVMMVTQN